jgi:aspartate/methionine/tyrosine aminotransferase
MKQRSFPRSDIISLLDVSLRFNLAESTTDDLSVSTLLALVDREKLGGLRLGYGSSQGLTELRESVARAAGVTPEKVITTQGTALGIAILALELCGGGAEAVLFTPCFPPSKDMIVGIGAGIREVPLRFEDGFGVDLQRFADALSTSVSLVSIASPQNPSGVATPLATIKEMLEIMARRAPDALLFVDETYIAAPLPGAALTSAANLDERIIVGSSVSKAHGAPGLRVGWLIVHDDDLRERLTTAKMNLVISGSPLNETLAAALLENAEELMTSRRLFLAAALERLADWQAQNAQFVDWVRPDGGALCVMRLRPQIYPDSAVDLFWSCLPGEDLQLAPGTWFGLSSREFRLGFGYLQLNELERGLNELSGLLRRLSERAEARPASCSILSGAGQERGFPDRTIESED